MFNNNLKKRFTKLLISINQLIESFFNFIKISIQIKKRNKTQLKNIDKRITISLSLIVIFI